MITLGCRVGEAGAVADGDQQHGGGHDVDAGQRRQDRGKRVGLQLVTWVSRARRCSGRRRASGPGTYRDVEGAGAGIVDGLLVERVEDLVDQLYCLRGALGLMVSTSLRRPAPRRVAGGSVAVQQPGDGLVVRRGSKTRFRLGGIG